MEAVAGPGQEACANAVSKTMGSRAEGSSRGEGRRAVPRADRRPGGSGRGQEVGDGRAGGGAQPVSLDVRRRRRRRARLEAERAKAESLQRPVTLRTGATPGDE